MLKKILFILIACHLLIINVSAQTKSGMKIKFGSTPGIMDLAFDVSSYMQYNKVKFIYPEFGWSLSLYESTKTNLSSNWDVQTTGIYALGKYYLLTNSKIIPYISFGPGFHYIISYSNADSDVGEHGFSKDWRHAFTVKVHTFLGCQFDISRKLFLSLEGRATYPSDIIFDSGYFGLGIKFR